jgi:nitrogen fixation protein
MRSLIVATILLPGLVGCAQVHVQRLSPDERRGTSVEGVRFFRPWPYLLVTAEPGDKGTTYKSEVIYLPKADEEYVVRVQPGWGTAEGSVKLEDGWRLSELGSTVDSKIPETITAVSGLITAAGGVAAAGATNQNWIVPGLYRIKFNDDGYVSGLVLVPPP